MKLNDSVKFCRMDYMYKVLNVECKVYKVRS